MPVGLTPRSADEVNANVGNLLRQFVDIRERVNQTQASLAPLDLKGEPYMMSEGDETAIKSAINDLDVALDAVDMTFIDRLVGIW